MFDRLRYILLFRHRTAFNIVTVILFLVFIVALVTQNVALIAPSLFRSASSWIVDNALLLINIVVAMVALGGAGSVMYRFLQTRDTFETVSQQSRRGETSDNLEHRLERLQRDISELRLSKQSSVDVPQITHEVRTFVQQTLAREIIESVEQKYKTFLEERASYSPMKDRLEALSATLSVQLKSQSNRANFNLIAGALIAGVGFGALGWLTVFGYMDSGLTGNLEKFAVWYIPKLTFVIVIEAFSYFFLSLYRSGLGEVKFFQNEITNLESKIAAGYAAIGSGDQNLLRVAIERLANTERNFVLKKGERNVSEQFEGKIRSQFVDAIAEALKTYNTKSGS